MELSLDRFAVETWSETFMGVVDEMIRWTGFSEDATRDMLSAEEEVEMDIEALAEKVKLSEAYWEAGSKEITPEKLD